MAPDERTPVIAGVAQATWLHDAPDPVAMLAEVARAAARDAEPRGRLLERLDSLAVVHSLSIPHADPAALLAARLRLRPGERVRSALGGDSPQLLVNDLCERIARGELEVALVCGCEALATGARALAAGEPTGWPEPEPGAAPDRVVGIERAGGSEAEARAGLIAPVVIYPLLENALWASEGGDLAKHRSALGALWARFSAVAAHNPFAWDREPHDAEAIATPGPANRVVSLPYTKLMNANIRTDQAAALLLCSAGAARAAGVPADRLVFPQAGADGAERWNISERRDLRSAPVLGLAARAALRDAGVEVGEVALLDIYSCFPSAVRIAAAEIGVPLDDPGRPPTVTGGLSFAGGPGSNYTTHAIATLSERLRERPGETGMATAVGWYMTKHAVGIYSARPPASGFRRRSVGAESAGAPGREVAPADTSGTATLESLTVLHDRAGTPTAATVAALLADGRRALVRTEDPATLDTLSDGPPAPRPVELDGAGSFALGV